MDLLTRVALKQTKVQHELKQTLETALAAPFFL